MLRVGRCCEALRVAGLRPMPDLMPVTEMQQILELDFLS
jgi:hypothetical protein